MDRFLPFLGLIVLVGLSSYITGRVWTLQQFADPPFLLEPDLRLRVPVVQVKGIQKGVVIGHISGDVRVFWGDHMVLPDGSGAFQIADDLLMEEVTVRVPDGMPFVASRRGKMYYSVTSPMGERIKPENRVHFSTAADAEASGFLPSSSP